jgi:transcriptional regulator with XRE-family HTH domain
MTASKKTSKSAPKTPAENPPLAVTFGEKARRENQIPPEKGIGGRIKVAREKQENGLSVVDLSRMCKLIDPVGQGISHQTLIKYEKGIVLPGSRELRILCDALAVSADWLIFGFERGEKGSSVLPLEDALTELAGLLRDRMVAKNPIKHIAPQADVVRPTLLAKAREPTPRK